MNLKFIGREKVDEGCIHEWMVEPTWRLVSIGQCQKCMAIEYFRNDHDFEEPVRKSRFFWRR